MKRPKVLYVVHNHPDNRPGGAETHALELYQAMREAGEFEPFLVAKAGAPVSAHLRGHPGTCLGAANGDPNQMFLFTDGYRFDYLTGTIQGKDFYTRHFRNLLRTIQPDVVHFQHTLFLGYDMIREVHNTLPGVPILYTLHEYLPICHSQGQMIRGSGIDDRCLQESPRRCHECFPDITVDSFLLRKRFVMANFDLVDRFLAPSHFLRQRFIDWGLPAGRIEFHDYGRRPVEPRAAAPAEGGRRSRLGFFGQTTATKGLHVLLAAMKQVGDEPSESSAPTGTPPRLWVHGANLDIQHADYREKIHRLLDETRDNVRWVGRYTADELPRLLDKVDWVVVPSIWWENSPLVIQEAFLHGKPILCSDIGGMAEKVADGVNGLHFRAGDPMDLARVIRLAADTPGLWERLRAGIPPVFSMQESVRRMTSTYRQLMQQKASRPA